MMLWFAEKLPVEDEETLPYTDDVCTPSDKASALLMEYGTPKFAVPA